MRSSDDIRRNIADNRMSALLTLEEGGVIGGSIDRLHEFHEEGVRLITLTWNYENEIGYPNIIDTVTGRCEPETERGLKPCGIEIVKEMERLGMIIDVSHLGDAGFMMWHATRQSRLLQVIQTPVHLPGMCVILRMT